MHQNEYDWVRQTRETLLNFCEEVEPSDLTRRNGFSWQSVRDTLVHIADCYYAWLGSFVLLKTRNPLTPKEDLPTYTLDRIKVRFEQVDSIVKEVFAIHENQLNVLIEREIPWRKASELVQISPGKLLMHTITHEFHHKGQIVAMLRQMGYEPPNTDVLGTDD